MVTGTMMTWLTLVRWLAVACVLGSVVAFGVELARCIGAIWRGKPGRRTERPMSRLRHACAMGFGQKRVVERWWGFAHVVVFYAFLIFLTSTAEIFVATIWPGFRLRELVGDGVTGGLYLAQTWLAGLTILAVLVLGVRRLVMRAGLHSRPEAWAILGLILVLMTTHFFVMASALAQSVWPWWLTSGLPLTSRLSRVILPYAEPVGVMAGCLHLMCVAAFFVWIPRGKHLHIVLAFPDMFCQHRAYDAGGTPVLGPESPDVAQCEEALIQAMDSGVPEEDWPVLGIVRWRDVPRKMRLEAFACTQCMRCTHVCPMVAAGVGHARGPLDAMLALRRLCRCEEGTPDAVMSREECWNCTLCGACDRACPVGNEISARTIELRRGAVWREAMPASCHGVFARFEKSGNPWGYPRAERMAWTQSVLGGGAENDGENAGDDARVRCRVLLFAGCFASYDPAARASLLHAVAWLKAQRFEVIVPETEACCGEPMRALGNETAFARCREENLARFARMPHDLIVTMCPHCAQTLREDYCDGECRLNVMHLWTLMARLYDEGALEMASRTALDGAVVHVPCHLGKAYDAKSLVNLARAMGARFDGAVERTHCCGAGGGQFFIDGGRDMARQRVRELGNVGAERIATACPFCVDMLGAAEAAQNAACGAGISLIPVVNVVDVLAENAAVPPEAWPRAVERLKRG